MYSPIRLLFAHIALSRYVIGVSNTVNEESAGQIIIFGFADHERTVSGLTFLMEATFAGIIVPLLHVNELIESVVYHQVFDPKVSTTPNHQVST